MNVAPMSSRSSRRAATPAISSAANRAGGSSPAAKRKGHLPRPRHCRAGKEVLLRLVTTADVVTTTSLRPPQASSGSLPTTAWPAIRRSFTSTLKGPGPDRRPTAIDGAHVAGACQSDEPLELVRSMLPELKRPRSSSMTVTAVCDAFESHQAPQAAPSTVRAQRC